MKPKECLLSISLCEIVFDLVQSESYRRTAGIVNRVLHRSKENSMIPVTVEARTVALGKAISEEYMREAACILKQHGVDTKTGIPDEKSSIPERAANPTVPPNVSSRKARELTEAHNEGRIQRERINHTEKAERTESAAKDCVYISVDDIGVKHQKEQRAPGREKDRKYVENTVIHIQADALQYTLTAVGMRNAFMQLLAFLLCNRLMEDRRLIFLTDGATDIKEHVETFFAFREYTIILDWLHLKKKCKEYLSMAVKGTGKTKESRREDKASIVRNLLRILWAGNHDEAMEYLNTLDQKNISRQDILKQTTEYIARKQDNIACYAFRHRMGLRVSSNRVEKANDILVGSRQKHNGMSWSVKGSAALAAITSARVNGKLGGWMTGEKELLVVTNELDEAA